MAPVDWLLVGRANDYGFARDARLLADAIERTGASTGFSEKRKRGLFDFLLRRKRAKGVLHIERAFPTWFGAAKRNWLMPNQERFPHRHLKRLRHIDLVLAKSRHAEEIFRALGARAAYLGFTSEDRRDASVTKDWNRFFHLAGGSTLKGTEDVVALWAAHPEWPELVLVQKAMHAPKSVPANVRLFSGYMDDADLKRLQNGCGIHLCPSRAEGWGHYIVEALSVGAVVVTTDAPPMNEIVGPDFGILLPYLRSEPRHLGWCYYVDPKGLEAAVKRLIAMPAAEKEAMGVRGRAHYEAIAQGFEERVRALLGPAGTAADVGAAGGR